VSGRAQGRWHFVGRTADRVFTVGPCRGCEGGAVVGAPRTSRLSAVASEGGKGRLSAVAGQGGRAGSRSLACISFVVCYGSGGEDWMRERRDD
jgi:hypothetical protein